ncbi:hypothetical protein [Paenibacillus illinoisensis]|uniref:hypothetical protein n=1 Tax=Paenibacillus illinoisensis TaxID=59845 RepID=UPI003D2B625C
MQKKNGSQILKSIELQKKERIRPFPSDKLITNGEFLEIEDRMRIIDKSAALVDQAYGGRSDMCLYFACLVRYALRLLGYKANVCIGEATYINNDVQFSWEHSWVEFEDYIIDCNVDTMVENPAVPVGLDPKPYWGKNVDLPLDRRFKMEVQADVSEELDALDRIYIEWKYKLKLFLKSQQMI